MSAQFQGANLRNAQFQGCISDILEQWKIDFDEQIMQRVNEDAELSGAIFADGIQQRDLDRMVEDLGHIKAMSRKELDKFIEALDKHVGEPERYGADSIHAQYYDGVGLGAYTKAKAKKWIASYEESMETAASPDEA